jgi:hypothetical protein
MAMIRAALKDDDLQALLAGSYTPERIIKIQKESPQTSGFTEDCFITTKKIRRKPVKGQTPKKAIPPSKRFETALSEFEQGVRAADAEVVLGYYFGMYKRFFHEEDPDWSGANTHPAVVMVQRMAREVTEGDYRKLAIFVRKILPMWIQRLKDNEEFPGRRPTLPALFSGRRYFWANRNILYKQWQRR